MVVYLHVLFAFRCLAVLWNQVPLHQECPLGQIEGQLETEEADHDSPSVQSITEQLIAFHPYTGKEREWQPSAS